MVFWTFYFGFQASFDCKTNVALDNSFTLNDLVINTKVNGQEPLLMQLIAKEDNGSIQMQYMGTKV